MFQTAEIGFEVLDFLGLGFILASVCFEFRASDFEQPSIVIRGEKTWLDENFCF